MARSMATDALGGEADRLARASTLPLRMHGRKLRGLPGRPQSTRADPFRSSSAEPSGANTSTENENFRSSPGSIAPTPTIWRETSSPFSFVIVITAAYSHASPTFGCRIDPSTRSGEKEGAVTAPPFAPGAKRTCFRHDGQTIVLCKITARQCGHVRVAPAGVFRTVVVTRPSYSPARSKVSKEAGRARLPTRIPRGHACASPRQR
jgi:hypothetical protein